MAISHESVPLGTRVRSTKFGEGSVTGTEDYSAWEARRGHCKITVAFDGGARRDYDLATVRHTGLLDLGEGGSPLPVTRGLRHKQAPARPGLPARCFCAAGTPESAPTNDDGECDPSETDDIGSGLGR